MQAAAPTRTPPVKRVPVPRRDRDVAAARMLPYTHSWAEDRTRWPRSPTYTPDTTAAMDHDYHSGRAPLVAHAAPPAQSYPPDLVPLLHQLHDRYQFEPPPAPKNSEQTTRHVMTPASTPPAQPPSGKDPEKGPEKGPADAKAPYSAFSPWRRRFILTVITVAGFFGPLAGGIYLPALPVLEVEFNASATAINITVSVFMLTFAFGVSKPVDTALCVGYFSLTDCSGSLCSGRVLPTGRAVGRCISSPSPSTLAPTFCWPRCRPTTLLWSS